MSKEKPCKNSIENGVEKKISGFSSRRFFLFVALIAMIGMSIFISYLSYTDRIFFPIKNVNVYFDSQQMNQDELQGIIKPYVSQGFFGIDLADLQSKLQTFPIVSYAVIQRRWPDQLSIHLVNQNILAFWNDNEVMNNYGEIMPINRDMHFTDLPHFSGPIDERISILENYQKMRALLDPLNLSIKSISVSPQVYWTVTLNTDTVLKLCYDGMIDRLENFAAVYSKVFADKKPPAMINFCYEHGMAVKW